jgi:hypothetical protein
MGRWLPALLGALLLVTACAAGPTHAQPPSASSYVPPVDCGLVTSPTGKRDVVSPALPAGTADCGEVLNVLYSYYRDAPHKAQGTARRLVVDGWTCEADTDDRNASQVGCDKNGVAFLTQTQRA